MLASLAAALALGGIVLVFGGRFPAARAVLEGSGVGSDLVLALVPSRRRSSAFARASFRFVRRRAEHDICLGRWSKAHACRRSLTLAPFVATVCVSQSWSVSEEICGSRGAG